MDELRQNEEMRQDVERVVELACRNLSPADQNLLRWAAGVSERPRKELWQEMACACGEE